MTRDELLGANRLGLVAGANHRIKVMAAGDNEVGLRRDSAIGELVIDDPSSATRRTRRNACQPRRYAGFAAAHG
jgi:hypothetical protein